MNKVKMEYSSRFAIVGFAAALLYGPAVALAATSPTLGAAGSYSVLAGSTVTNTGPTIAPGDLGVSPGSAVTGFPPGIVGPPGTIHTADASAAAAQLANGAAFLALSAPPNVACDHDFGAVVQDLVGLTLVPGVYCANAFTLSGTLTLDDTGAPSGVWIFRSASTLITSSGVNAAVQFLKGVGSPCNVWWKVGSSATIGVGTTFIGNILALTSIALETNSTLAGRALAQNGAVTMDSNHVSGCNTGGSLCGNGVINGGEACDDGNTANGDGCSSICTVEAGYQCSGQPSVCTPIGPIPAVCGDGLISIGEACDDGNTVSGDGCSSTCTVEAGFNCSGQPSVCTPFCIDANPLLGAANECTILQSGSPTAGKYKVEMSGPMVRGGVQGDLCIGAGSKLELSGTNIVTGEILLDGGPPPATCKSSDPKVKCPKVFTDLDAQISACDLASTTNALKACTLGNYTQSLTALAGPTGTITGGAGENVICVKEVHVDGSHIIHLTGGPTTSFVINVHGKFEVSGSAKIRGDGVNVTPADILYNIIGTGELINLSGTSELDGSMISVQREINCGPCLIHGQICGDRNIDIHSGASVQCPVPR